MSSRSSREGGLRHNFLVAGVVAEGLCRDIVKRRLTRVELVTSQILLDGLAKTLRRKFGTNPADVPLVAAYRERATLVHPVPPGAADLPRPMARLLIPLGSPRPLPVLAGLSGVEGRGNLRP